MIQPSITGIDYQKLLSWYGFHEEYGWETLQKFLFKYLNHLKYLSVVSKNEAVGQLKANFIYWKAICVSLDFTHRLAVCAHFKRNLPPSLWTMVLQTSGSVYHLKSVINCSKEKLIQKELLV